MTAPFGIEIHKQLDSSCIVADLGQNKFKITPPRPHPSFETYFVQTSKVYGVVWIKGVSPAVESDAFGVQVRALHDRISGQLQSKYGRPDKADGLQAGSIWDDPQYWTMSVAQNERFFFHIWEANKSNLPDDLHSLFLGLNALDGNTCSVIIEYSSTKADAAEQESDADLSDLL